MAINPMTGVEEDDELMSPEAPDPQLDLAQKIVASPNTSPALKNVVAKKYNLSDYSPEKRQAIVDENNSYDTTGAISGALASLSAGFQGKDSMNAVAQNMNQRNAIKKDRLAQFDKSRENAVQDVSLARDNEKHDPNSRQSKIVQETVRKLYPNIFSDDQIGNLAAADSDIILKPLELKAKFDGVAAQRAAVLANKDLTNQMRSNALSERQAQAVDKLAKDMRSDLDADKGRAGNFGQISGKVQGAQRLQTLVDAYKGGDLPRAQMEELSLGLANMMAGSSGAGRAQVEALVPHTLWGNAQDAGSWLMNEPRGAGQQKFVEQMAHTIKREQDVANDQLNSIRAARLPAHSRLKQLAPDQYNSLLQSYGLDPNSIKDGKYQAPQPSTVKMKAPDGSIREVPLAQVEAAKKAGGLPVDESMAAQ